MAQTFAIFAGTIFTTTAATAGRLVPASADWIGVMLDVTQVTGTDSPAIVFRVQWSMDGGHWADADPVDEFAPITGPIAVTKRFEVKAPYWRAYAEVSGTNATFTGTANAYC